MTDLKNNIRQKQIQAIKDADANISRRNFRTEFDFVREFNVKKTPEIELERATDEAKLIPLEQAIENSIDTTNQRILMYHGARAVGTPAPSPLSTPLAINAPTAKIAENWNKLVIGGKVPYGVVRFIPRIEDAIALCYEATILGMIVPEFKALEQIKTKIQNSDFTPLNRSDVSEMNPINRREKRLGVPQEEPEFETERVKDVPRPISTAERYKERKDILTNYMDEAKDEYDKADQLTTDKNQIEADIQALIDRNALADKYLEDIKNDVGLLKTEQDANAIEIDKKYEELDQLDSTDPTEKAKIDALAKEITDLEDRNKYIKKTVAFAQKGVKGMMKDYRKREAKLATEIKKLDPLQKQIDKQIEKYKRAQEKAEKQANIKTEFKRKALGKGKSSIDESEPDLTPNNIRKEKKAIRLMVRNSTEPATLKKNVLETRLQKQNMLGKKLLPQSEVAVFDDSRNDPYSHHY